MSKTFQLETIGSVTIEKRRGQKSLRVNITSGRVKVTQPFWLPYRAGEEYARSKQQWIQEHIRKNAIIDGSRCGRKTIKLLSGEQQRYKESPSYILVWLVGDYDSQENQTYLKKIMQKALRRQAEEYLPARTRHLAQEHGFEYVSVSIKSLRRRWGSCSASREIVFNLHLMQLEHNHIDYVILHELVHTLHMNHSREFWDKLESVFPNARTVAKVVRRGA